MPIYECHCLTCDLTFEVLAPVSAARKSQACPDCGRASQRIVSAFAIASASADTEREKQNARRAPVKKDPRPLCLQHPHLPLLCHMDETAAKRWIAHSQGRGSEFDDKLSKREEVRKQRGAPAPAKPDAPAHGHSHDFRRHGKMTEAATAAPASSAAPAAPTHGHAHSHAHGKAYGHSHASPKSHGHSHSGSHAHSR